MVIFPFLRRGLFWLPIVLVCALELSFRLGWWESWMIWNSHAGRTIATKRALASIDRSGVNYVMLGDSRAHQGFNHEQLAEQARAQQAGYVDFALPGSHFLSFKVLSRYARDQLPQLNGLILVVPPAFLQSLGNGEYELGIVHPLRSYTSTEEMLQHVPLQADKLSTWASISELVAYRDNVQQLLRNGFTDQRIGQVNVGPWWLRWTAEYSENLCEVPLQEAELCTRLQQEAAGNPAEASVKQFCSRPGLGSKTNAAAQQTWLDRRAGISAAWREYLGELSAQYRVLVVTLPMLPLFAEYEVLPEAEQASHHLLAQLQDEGQIEWLDLSQRLNPAEPECQFYRDPWHLNQVGQAAMTAVLKDYLQQHWYSNAEPAH